MEIYSASSDISDEPFSIIPKCNDNQFHISQDDIPTLFIDELFNEDTVILLSSSDCSNNTGFFFVKIGAIKILPMKTCQISHVQRQNPRTMKHHP